MKDDGSRAMCGTSAEEMVDKALENVDEDEGLEEINFDAIEFHPEMECFYSTKRDSKKAVSRWVENLGTENMKILEELDSCKKIMKTYGYKKVDRLPEVERPVEIDDYPGDYEEDDDVDGDSDYSEDIKKLTKIAKKWKRKPTTVQVFKTEDKITISLNDVLDVNFKMKF